MASGAGYVGGYGTIARSAYATPAELGAKPWALDFSPKDGWLGFPTHQRVNPIPLNLQWRNEDWDPGLRFWDLPFDTQLQEWLQDVDLSAPSIRAAREFAALHKHWEALEDTQTGQYKWIEADDLKWRPSSTRGVTDTVAWNAINQELHELVRLMAVDRGRYLDEAWLQSDNIPLYFMHFLGMDSASKPWTAELMRCGLAMGNLVYMHYKAHFKRVRPSTLCAGLVPPWGPPRHPAFPSGHSFLGHFIALLLLKIEGIAQRYGIFKNDADVGSIPELADFQNKANAPATLVAYGQDMHCPLLWLAFRLARNRERIGVHYRSDSSASRSLAIHLWNELLNGNGELNTGTPTLRSVLRRAEAEWA